jgi:hypothetical protein
MRSSHTPSHLRHTRAPSSPASVPGDGAAVLVLVVLALVRVRVLLLALALVLVLVLALVLALSLVLPLVLPLVVLVLLVLVLAVLALAQVLVLVLPLTLPLREPPWRRAACDDATEDQQGWPRACVCACAYVSGDESAERRFARARQFCWELQPARVPSRTHHHHGTVRTYARCTST